MLRRFIFGSFAISISICAAVLFLASCGEVTDKTPLGAGGAGGASSSTAASTTSGEGVGGAGGAGSGGNSCAGAASIEFGEIADGDLAVTGQQDFYRFLGKKGQVVMIDINAQIYDDAEFDPTYIDSVVTLFNADGVSIAQNNDPIEYSTNDSRLYTILPADSEYCLRVAECWTVAPNPAANCRGEKDKLVTTYKAILYELVDEPGDAFTAEVESGDDAASATAIEYAKSSDGVYVTTFWGTFDDPSDIDVWSFTIPADLTPPPPSGVRTIGRFYIMPSGPNHNGSTAPVGKVWVADAMAPGVALAQVDAAKNPEFFPRLELGTPYLLFVTRPKGMALANDFYFVRHYPAWSFPLELEKGIGANDTPATAEAMTFDQNGFGIVEGALAMGAQDVDHFVVTVAPGMKTARAQCRAQRLGSGLRGLSLSLLAADGSPLASGAGDTETETHYASVTNVPLGGAGQVILKVEAASQDAAVADAFYDCFIKLAP